MSAHSVISDCTEDVNDIQEIKKKARRKSSAALSMKQRGFSEERSHALSINKRKFSSLSKAHENF